MPKQKLKMWVWEDVLTDYWSGLVVAYAETAEQAIDLFLKCGALPSPEDHVDGIKIDGKLPVCHNMPTCVAVCGGS